MLVILGSTLHTKLSMPSKCRVYSVSVMGATASMILPNTSIPMPNTAILMDASCTSTEVGKIMGFEETVTLS